MKATTLLQPAETLQYPILQRNAIAGKPQQEKKKKFSRRASRKNLLLFAIGYSIVVSYILYHFL